MSLKQILLARIAEDGPVPFEEFQAAALYHPQHGFFSRGELRSTKAGDFLTSPEVSPFFGETLARFVEQEHERILDSSPAGGGGGGFERSSETEGAALKLHLVEVGAGSGSLLRPLLESLDLCPEVWAVEASPMARKALAGLYSSPAAGRGGGFGRSPETEGEDSTHGIVPPKGVRGQGQLNVPRINVVSSLEELPDGLTGVVIANELVDNLPVAIAVKTEGGWRERWVGADGDELALVDAPARTEIVEWCDRFAGPCPVDGYVEVQLAAAGWLKSVLAKLDHGAVVLIDYGDTAENLEPRRTEGTLRTYRAHHLGPHPLDEPGETDITVDVNFSALAKVAEEAGARTEYHRQDEFLASLGLRDKLSQLRRDELALARDGDPLERLRIRSAKNEVETLLHPRGLGDFRVLVARRD